MPNEIDIYQPRYLAEVVPQHNEISRQKRGAIELMLQTDEVRAQLEEPQQKSTLIGAFLLWLCEN